MANKPERVDTVARPIEMAFSKLKAHLRAAATRTFNALSKAIGNTCDLFSRNECWNYLKEAGYASIKCSPLYASRSATTPKTMSSAASKRQREIASPSMVTEISMAKRIEVSRNAATAAIGALVIAHIAIQ